MGLNGHSRLVQQDVERHHEAPGTNTAKRFDLYSRHCVNMWPILMGLTRIVCKSGFHVCHFWSFCTNTCNDVWFHKGGKSGCCVLLINDILEYNPPYVQSNFTCNPGPTILITHKQGIKIREE